MTGAVVVMLVVEDHPADVVFFQEAINAAGLPSEIHDFALAFREPLRRV